MFICMASVPRRHIPSHPVVYCPSCVLGVGPRRVTFNHSSLLPQCKEYGLSALTSSPVQSHCITPCLSYPAIQSCQLSHVLSHPVLSHIPAYKVCGISALYPMLPLPPAEHVSWSALLEGVIQVNKIYTRSATICLWPQGNVHVCSFNCCMTDRPISVLANERCSWFCVRSSGWWFAHLWTTGNCFSFHCVGRASLRERNRLVVFSVLLRWWLDKVLQHPPVAVWVWKIFSHYSVYHDREPRTSRRNSSSDHNQFGKLFLLAMHSNIIPVRWPSCWNNFFSATASRNTLLKLPARGVRSLHEDMGLRDFSALPWNTQKDNKNRLQLNGANSNDIRWGAAVQLIQKDTAQGRRILSVWGMFLNFAWNRVSLPTMNVWKTCASCPKIKRAMFRTSCAQASNWPWLRDFGSVVNIAQERDKPANQRRIRWSNAPLHSIDTIKNKIGACVLRLQVNFCTCVE